MKKKIFALAIAMLSIGSLTVMAQSHNPNNECQGKCANEQQCVSPEQCVKGNANPEGCPKMNKCDKKNRKPGECRRGECNGKEFKGCIGKREHGSKKAKFDAETAFNELNLTPGQKAEVEKIMSDRKKDMAKVQEKERKEKAKIFEKYDNKLAKVLTPEQYQKFVSKRSSLIRNSGESKIGKKVKSYKGNKGVIGKPQKGPNPPMQTR